MYAITRSASASVNSGATVAVVLTPMAGNLLVALVSVEQTGVFDGTTPIQDTALNEWTLAGGEFVDHSTKFRLYYVKRAKTTILPITNTITVNFSTAGTNRVLVVREFYGQRLPEPLLEVQTGSGATGTSLATADFAAHNPAALVVALAKAEGVPITTPFTMLDQVNFAYADGPGTLRLGDAYRYNTVSAAAATFAQTTSDTWAVVGASFASKPQVPGQIDKRIDVQLVDGQWTNITEDAIRDDIEVSYGITGDDPKDVLASPGRMSFTLNNSVANSGRVQGWYSLDHASKRAGWDENRPCRLVLSYIYRGPPSNVGVSVTKFQGKIFRIDPSSGLDGDLAARVIVYDTMQDLLDAELPTLTVQVNQNENQLLQTFFNALPVQNQPPNSTALSAGVDFITFAFHTNKPGTRAATLLSELLRNVHGWGSMQGGRFWYHSRQWLGEVGTNWTFSGTTVDMDRPHGLEGVYNRVVVNLRRQRLGITATEELLKITDPIVLAASEVLVISVPYRDPLNTTTQIGGTDFQTLVAGTDYTANSLADGSGTNRTADLSVVVNTYGTEAKFTFTNTSGTPLWRTMFRLRGRGLYLYDPQEIESTPAAETYGIREYRDEFKIQSDIEVVKSIANNIVASRRSLRNRLQSFTFHANRNDTQVEAAISGEIAYKTMVSEIVTGLTTTRTIRHVTLNLSVEGLTTVKWGLSAPHGTYTAVELPIIDWSGATSGTQNMRANPFLPFLTVGTYTVTVRRNMTVQLRGIGGGGRGFGDSGNNGGGGNAGGTATTGTSISLVTGKTYTLVVGAAGTGAVGTAGGDTSWTNTTDTIVQMRVKGGGSASSNVGSNLITGGNGGNGGINAGAGQATAGQTIATGAGGGGGGAFRDGGPPETFPGAAGGGGLAGAGEAGNAAQHPVASGAGGRGTGWRANGLPEGLHYGAGGGGAGGGNTTGFGSQFAKDGYPGVLIVDFVS